MKFNERGGAYEAPRIEWFDIAVEAGFAVSDATGGTTTDFGDGGNLGDSEDQWN